MTLQTNHLGSAAAVSIIVPTLASADRRDHLLRAVRSALAASHGTVKVIVCVNGGRSDADSISTVECIDGVELHKLAEPSAPKAVAYGRSKVTTAFFGFLDDDDELLPGSLDTKLRAFFLQPSCDVVAANGIRRTNGGDKIMLRRLNAVPLNPLGSLFEENWLPSCGALFRTATVGQSYFDDHHEYAEWTWLAYRLAIDGKRVAVVDEPTFIVNDTGGSLSKSTAYRNAFLALYERMLERKPPVSIRGVIRRRMANALHELSNDRLNEGELLESTRLHLRSLLLPGGLRYVSYSRRIGMAALLGNRGNFTP